MKNINCIVGNLEYRMGFKLAFLCMCSISVAVASGEVACGDPEALTIRPEVVQCQAGNAVVTVEINPLAKIQSGVLEIKFPDKTSFEVHCVNGKPIEVVPKSEFRWGPLSFEANSHISSGKNGLVVRPDKKRVFFKGVNVENISIVDLSFVGLFENSVLSEDVRKFRLSKLVQDEKVPFLFKGLVQQDDYQHGGPISKGSEVQWLGGTINTITLGRDTEFHSKNKSFVVPAGTIYWVGGPLKLLELSGPINMYGLQIPKGTRIYFTEEKLFFMFKKLFVRSASQFKPGILYQFDTKNGEMSEARNLAVQSNCFNICDDGYIMRRVKRDSKNDNLVGIEADWNHPGAAISVVGSKGGSLAYYHDSELKCSSPESFSSCMVTKLYRLSNSDIGDILGYFSNPYSVSGVQKLNFRKMQARKEMFEGNLPHVYRNFFSKNYKWKIDFTNGLACKEPDRVNDNRREIDEDNTDGDGHIVEVENNFEEIKGYDKKSGYIKRKITSAEQDRELLKIKSEGLIFYVADKDFVYVTNDPGEGDFIYRITVDGIQGYLSNNMKGLPLRANPDKVSSYQFHWVYNDNTMDKELSCEDMDGCH